jgi:hypothetical protein
MFSTNTLPTDLIERIHSQAAALAADPSFLPTMAGSFRVGPEHTPSESDLWLFHTWLAAEVVAIPARLDFVARHVPLSEAVHALTRPILPGETRLLPVSTRGTSPVAGLMTVEQNLMFRAVHDHMHARLGVDDSWFGELATTLGHLHTAPPQIWPILASEVAGQAAVSIFEGDFPEQRLSGLCLRMLAIHESNPLCF